MSRAPKKVVVDTNVLVNGRVVYGGDWKGDDWKQLRNSIAHSDSEGTSFIYVSHHGTDPKVFKGSYVRVTNIEPGLNVTAVQPLSPPPNGPITHMTLTSPADDHFFVPIPGNYTLEGQPARLVVTRRSSPILPWLDSAAVFVPKTIREPFVGDLREDMKDKLAAGWSPIWVKAIAISQVAVLVVRWLWSTGWFRALRGGGS